MKPEKLTKIHIIEVTVLEPEYIVDSYNKLVDSYNKLVDRIDELETEVFSLRNRNKLWECIAAGYKKEEAERLKQQKKEEKE